MKLKRDQLSLLLKEQGLGRALPRSGSETLATGIPDLDLLLAGGICRGRITEISGPRSSGRTSLALSLAARVTGRGEAVAWIDTDSFNPLSAQHWDVDLSRLLWIRCPGPRAALQAADILCQAGSLGMVVLDLDSLAAGPARQHALPGERRLPLSRSHFWFRLQRGVEASRTCLLVVSRRPVAGNAARRALTLRRTRVFWMGRASTWRSLQGISVQMQTEAGSLAVNMGCSGEQRGENPRWRARSCNAGAADRMHLP